MTSQSLSPASANNLEGPVSETALVPASNPLLTKVAEALGTATETVGNAAQTVSQTTGQVAQTIGKVAKDTGNTLTSTVNQTGQLITNTTIAATSQASQLVAKTATSVSQGTSQATTNAGQLTEWGQNNHLFRMATETLNLDWLMHRLDTVDVQKAMTEVHQLKVKYPDDSPRQLAHRLMVRKATLAAGTGLASSALPGLGTALFALDFAVTMSLQAELVYQIAAAYGLDLKDPSRKGEVLAIFGLSMGGNKAIEGGLQYATRAGILGFLKNIPAAGAAIGCSTNAAMTYSLGYGACRFYEAQLSPLQSEQILEASTDASDEYLQQALAQEVAMDLILVHVVLAATPEKSLKEALPQLRQTLGLSPATLETLEKNPLPKLSDLASQINRDFAAPLVARCQKIAEFDGIIRESEALVLKEIREALVQKTIRRY